MGLDMYLYKTTKTKTIPFKKLKGINNFLYKHCYHNKKSLSSAIDIIARHYPEIKKVKIYSEGKYFFTLFSQIAYWRNANAIHRYFVQNVQNGKDDCGYYQVSPDVLTNLLTLCEKVEKHLHLAPELLPTQDGFFFGKTDYNDWYFYQLKETIKQIKNILKSIDFDKYWIAYHSSW